ncbi:DUF262 domain-containing protein [Planktothrix mougeotii]|uniref:DUF262 domain-containing protein n=1 Tax=Planktothrix mougeotii LEGE 06226 TaxID=1828728 RepID=A0ABR9U7H8_9CYAN|nr:DUF262 domain-containing protein [Planktothrix mougeotii]MBE9142400.1 DUF262 domain-containing protein [Planktothrix mougeotii LEGE 06226]
MINSQNEQLELKIEKDGIEYQTDMDLEDFDDDNIIEADDEGINEPFDPTKIRVDTRQMTIDLVLSRINHGEIDLAPSFQRSDIWTDKAQSKLIESILLRIPLPSFYMDATDDDRWVVIDGRQRLTALKKFILNKELKLTDELDYLTDIQEKTYDELPRKYQRRLLETQLTIYVVEEGTPPSVKYNIFRRINTGGVPLSPQETRNALNQGKATKILSKLANMKEFKKVTNLDKSRKKKRMIDQEFVLGFLAFKINNYQDYYQSKSRDDFFHKTMEEINQSLSEDKLKEIVDSFKRSMIAAYDIFGDTAFRKISNQNGRRYPVNEALFEAWSVNLSKLDDTELHILKKRKEELKQKFSYLVDNDKDFLKSISQAGEKVSLRFSTVERIIQEVLAS